MSKINILNSEIYNKIAAGEVVERPSSVVKELLDNCIDAGATDIIVEVIGGGISQILIKDNGSGIERDSALIAFERYATSKISQESDLYNISTLGFRGEALSSIAAVSKVVLRTKTAADNTAMEYKVEGGVAGAVSECAHNDGTTIIVKEIFYNTPARHKFLKTPRSEEGDISNIISRYILANPQIRFLFKADGKIVLQSYGNGLLEAICNVYGKDTAKNLIEINHKTSDGFSLIGYIGKSSFTKPNRTYQTLAINGRYVINSTISAAVTNAYNQYLMKRQYPFYVLHLVLPVDFLDVNVHPNKLDVRFEDNKKIFSLFYQPLCKALEEDVLKIDLPKHNPGTMPAFNTSHGWEKNTINNNSAASTGAAGGDNLAEESYADSVLRRYDRLNKPYEYSPNQKVSSFEIPDFYKPNSAGSLVDDNLLKNRVSAYGNENNVASQADISKQNAATVFDDNNIGKITPQDTTSSVAEQQGQDLGVTGLVIHGAFFKTYIAAELGDNVYLIDQHAAHERILYDKFISAYLKGGLAVQPLLIPYIFSLNSQESEILEQHISHFNALGFNIENFGELTYKLSSIPADFVNLNINQFITQFISDKSKYRSPDSIDFVQEKIISKACKAAVKAGDALSKEEIELILNKLLKSDTVLLCPHGRPLVSIITKKDLEKMFKRIV